MGILVNRLLAPVDVVVDSREASKNRDIVDYLRRKGLEIAVAAMNAGDYYLLASEDRRALLVERKTVNDFLNSIRDNRLWEQLALLKEAARRENVDLLVVLEGSLTTVQRYRAWSIQAVLRILDTVTLEWRVPVLPTPDKEATARWLASKAKSLGSPRTKKPPRLRVERKPLTPVERALYVAEGLVGPVLARRLLSRFKTLRNLANAEIEDLIEVEGIGEKRAREIYEVFNTPFRA